MSDFRKSLEMQLPKHRFAARAFSLIEVMTAMAVFGVMAAGLYAGMAWCASSVKSARQNLRATEILTEKMEVIRLLTWDQIITNNVLPSTFTEEYVTTVVTNKKGTITLNGGLTYYGTITIVPPVQTQLLGNYTNDLRVVQVQLFWTNQGLANSRKVTSYVSRYGVQNYALN